MCGIAGYSLSIESGVDRTLTAQALFAAIADRGSDAVGYAYRSGEGPIVVHKQRTGVRDLLDAVAIPDDASQALLHVRGYTKGHPSLAANNHPIRHGAVVGIHNGIIANDEEIFARHGYDRAEPGMTVDSEAIFALVDRADDRRAALEELYGSLAAAWLDDRVADAVYLARGIGRPLWVGEGDHEVLFASTREALELAERYAGTALEKRQLDQGSAVRVARGRVDATVSFRVDPSFTEEAAPVRASHERHSCLERLAVLARRPRGAVAATAR
jgi:glucosamine 6-phosphate synthetase-like amidotransferase/phosphosugar isomerase protein